MTTPEPRVRVEQLVKDLEALRNKWLRVAHRSYSGDRALGYTMAAADLTAIIDRAGGTG